MSERLEPIRLYVGPDYKEPRLFTHTELMFPFWGVTAKESMPYVRTASMQNQYSLNDFALVESIQDADYVLIPYQYDRLLATNPKKIKKIIEEAHAAKKPLLIDGSGDIEHPINIPSASILRVSQYRYAIKANEITIPFVAEDLTESFFKGKPPVRQKSDKPSVGFTGWAALSFTSRLKIYFKEWPISLRSLIQPNRGAEHKGLLFRERALQALSNSRRIETRFKVRSTYSGHLSTISGSVEDTRKDFVDTLANSDYALCVKGDANSSVRFYEALSLGRIPLFVDTECVLPLENLLDYKDFCVFVDWKEIDRIGDILADFHENLSPERFIEMQKMARNAYENYLRTDKFSGQLAKILHNKA